MAIRCFVLRHQEVRPVGIVGQVNLISTVQLVDDTLADPQGVFDITTRINISDTPQQINTKVSNQVVTEAAAQGSAVTRAEILIVDLARG